MAYSAIEQKYLDLLATAAFPEAVDEPGMVGEEPSLDGVQLAMGSRGAKPGQGPKTMYDFASDVAQPFVGKGGMLDMGASAVKGAAQGFAGLPGDLESLGRMAINMLGGQVDETTVLPTTEEIKKWLDQFPAAKVGDGKNPYETLGEFAAPGGYVNAAKTSIRGAKAGARALAPAAADIIEGGMRKAGVIQDVVPPGPASGPAPLTTRERVAVTQAAGRKPALRQKATAAIESTHANYPEADGWMPIEIKKVTFKDSNKGDPKVEVEADKIAYAFHVPPEGVPTELWQATLSARLFDEVQSVVERAAGGDAAAVEIIRQAAWYRSMRDRLRAEFGGIGDVFADVLGTTSAQTAVQQNFENAIEILRRFSRGEFDAELAAFEKRMKSGRPIDAATLTALHKSGEFPLITNAAGKLFNTNSPPSMGALMDMFRAVKAGDSPKTPNFTGNLIGLTNEATIDVWAARMLRRLADLPRIPPPAEKGVAGKHLVGSSLYEPKVGSEFGFGQDVFREAAKEINDSGMIKQIAPEIGDLGPDDLQAVAWFMEKELWTNRGWTSKAGEGGSLDFEMSFAGADNQAGVKQLRSEINKGFTPPNRRKAETDEQYAARVDQARAAYESTKAGKQSELEGMKADVDRYTLGVSGERPDRPMSNYAQAELAAEFDDVVRNDKSVVTYNLANTYGSFMAQTERALNAEFVTKQGFNPQNLERRLVEQGKSYDQDAVFISKVVKGNAPNARPGVEIYFKQKVTPEQMDAITAKLRERGVDGFTYVTDMRFSDRINVQARPGGADTAGLNGVRFQYIPEFDDAFKETNRTQIMQDKIDLFNDIVEDIMKEQNVSDARLVFYDTKVYFRDDYDGYLARTTGPANSPQGRVAPDGANAAQPNNGRTQRQVVSGTVPDRLGGKAAPSKDPAVTPGRRASKKGGA